MDQGTDRDLHEHHRPHGDGHRHPDEAELADLLDLDAEVLGSYLAEVIEWVARRVRRAPRTVVDLGAGTGRGSLALARRFGSAEVVAIDRSEAMLERLEATARAQGLASRLRVVQADLDDPWPVVDDPDLVWASSSLHEVADPDRLLRDVRSALDPDGLLVVVEMALPRFLPDDVGLGRAGLEARCHVALAEAGWNAHPDWTPSLERAGFELAEQRSFSAGADPALPPTRRYAYEYLRHARTALAGRLASDDLDVLDALLDAESPEGLLRRPDLSVRGSRTAWAARPV